MVRWTKTALASIDDIAAYIAKDNPARAATFAQELHESTLKLANFPAMGKAGRVAGTRELVLHKNYVAIYRVKQQDVQILRIHHVAMNL